MDQLSNCPSLVNILSMLPSNDIILCMGVNKRIYSVIHNNWRRMAKQIVDLEIQKKANNSISLLFYRGSRCKPNTVVIRNRNFSLEPQNCALLIKTFFTKGKTYSQIAVDGARKSLRDFLQFILPRVKLNTLELTAENQYSTEEENDVLECLRDIYEGYVCELTCGSGVSRLYFRLHKLLLPETPFNFVLDKFDVEELNKILAFSQNATNQIIVTTKNASTWSAHIFLVIMEYWFLGNLLTERFKQYSPISNVERNILFEALSVPPDYVVQSDEDPNSFLFLIKRPIDKQHLAVNFSKNVMSVVQFNPFC